MRNGLRYLLCPIVAAVYSLGWLSPANCADRLMGLHSAQVMSQSIYPNNPTGLYHVCIERQPGSVQIRFSDAGTSVASQYFPNASRSLTEFDCRPHPSGGNMIKLVQKS